MDLVPSGCEMVAHLVPSGSNIDPNGNNDESQIRRGSHKKIPRRRFYVEGGELFMMLLQEENDPKNKLVDLFEGRKAIGSKWVLKIKLKADGTVERYKARLVVKGYTQQKGIDNEETFSPHVRFTSVRLVLDIVASLDLELH
ncbi:PREDICTED: uncharacterized protein LOC109236494 [Nicotiana attenuata]|uniref:uncharacterized protein LOC109236494 n=1 Tax=Nicotiana attenuata TaxID=49451 RepID=UPI0009058D41|nr:PREDICTED: uncharacterized protein LOC109236494 [Nicotiana attenuata]